MTRPPARFTLHPMLPPAEVTRQIIASRVALNRVRNAMAEDRDRTDLHQTIRREVDILSCLLDESEESVHGKINGLIDQFEILRRAMAN